MSRVAEMSPQLSQLTQAGQIEPATQAPMQGQLQTIHTSTSKVSGKLSGRVAVIAGGDHGIGRIIAIHFAREGVKGLAFLCNECHNVEIHRTMEMVQEEGCAKCICVPCDLTNFKMCGRAVKKVVKELGPIDVLVNNADEQYITNNMAAVGAQQLQHTFTDNLFSMYYLVKAGLPHLKPSAVIVNSASLIAMQRGKHQSDPSPNLLSSQTEAPGSNIASIARSLAKQLVPNGVIKRDSVTPLTPRTSTSGSSAGGSTCSTPRSFSGSNVSSDASEVVTPFLDTAAGGAACSNQILNGQYNDVDDSYPLVKDLV